MNDTQWLLDLVDQATPENLGPNDSTAKSGDAWLLLADLAPDLARLCVEQHEALKAVGDYAFGVWDGGREQAGRAAEELTRAALARFAELKP